MLSGTSILQNQVIPNLDMAPEDDRAIRSLSLGDWDELWHLGVVDDNDIGTTLSRCFQRPAFVRKPETCGIVSDPFFDLTQRFICGADIWRNDTLQDVVVGLGDAEDVRSRFGHEPGQD